MFWAEAMSQTFSALVESWWQRGKNHATQKHVELKKTQSLYCFWSHLTICFQNILSKLSGWKNFWGPACAVSPWTGFRSRYVIEVLSYWDWDHQNAVRHLVQSLRVLALPQTWGSIPPQQGVLPRSFTKAKKKHPTVGKAEIRKTHQLRLVVYPIIYRVHRSQVEEWFQFGPMGLKKSLRESQMESFLWQLAFGKLWYGTCTSTIISWKTWPTNWWMFHFRGYDSPKVYTHIEAI